MSHFYPPNPVFSTEIRTPLLHTLPSYVLSATHFPLNRRQFLSTTAKGLTSLGLLSVPGIGLSQTFWEYPRSLWLKRPATGEEQRVVYWANGGYLTDGYQLACHLLRDVRANMTVAMDPVLLDILRGMQGWFEAHGIYKPLVLNSGYRSPKTNRETEGAALTSQHVAGKAADLWIPDVPADYLGKLALYFQGGGVGFYPTKNFIHVDSGRLRVWRG